MSRRSPVGALAAGGIAVGVIAAGALAVGAIAAGANTVGALAVGALAVGANTVGANSREPPPVSEAPRRAGSGDSDGAARDGTIAGVARLRGRPAA